MTSPLALPIQIDPTCAALQQWTLRLLADAQALRALTNRGGKGRETLAALRREKIAQARGLAVEYFLRTGVRYWPEALPTPQPTLPLLPSLRALYKTEALREKGLRAQAAEEEAALANHYLALAEASRVTARRLRTLLEQAW